MRYYGPMMCSFAKYLEENLCQPGFSSFEPVVAFFDLDKTLIDGYSLSGLAWQMFFDGRVGPIRFLQLSKMFLSYALRHIGYEQMLKATVDNITGMAEADLVQLGQDAYVNRLAKKLYKEGRELVGAHMERGHDVVIITSATRYQAEPIAEELGIEHLCCTELEIVDGRVSGEVIACHGEGKLEAAKSYAASVGSQLRNAYFYSDSYDDLPLLEEVGQPVVVNGESAIIKVGVRRGWPHMEFNHTFD